MWQEHEQTMLMLFGAGWQDYVIAAGQWVFLIALLPALFAKEKPPLSTSVLTALVLSIFAYVFATLELWQSVASSVGVAGAWWILAFQRWRSLS